MGTFVTNPSETLPGPKNTTRTVPEGGNANDYFVAGDYNALRGACHDLRDSLLNLDVTTVDVTATGSAVPRSLADHMATITPPADTAPMKITKADGTTAVGQLSTANTFAGYQGTASAGAPRLTLGTNAPRFVQANGEGDDSAILLTRNLTGDSLFSHGVRDESKFNTATDGAYASFDAYPQFNGATVYNHFRGFQWRGEYLGSGSVGVMDGFAATMIHNGAGTVESAYGLHVYDPLGTGPITNNIGVYVRSLTRGSTLNYAFWADTNPVHAGGHITTGSELQSTGGLTHYEADGGVAIYGLSGDVYAAIKAYSNSGGTEKALILNPAGAGKVSTGGDFGVGGKFQMPTVGVPASASASGATGTITWDASYVYVCVSTNSWKRAAISTW